MHTVAISPLNPCNPRDLQRKSVESRMKNKLERETFAESIRREEQEKILATLTKQIALQPIQANPLNAKVVSQIEQIDELMSDCKASELPRLADAKSKLWQLLFPKPRAGKLRRDIQPSVEPLPNPETPQ